MSSMGNTMTNITGAKKKQTVVVAVADAETASLKIAQVMSLMEDFRWVRLPSYMPL